MKMFSLLSTSLRQQFMVGVSIVLYKSTAFRAPFLTKCILWYTFSSISKYAILARAICYENQFRSFIRLIDILVCSCVLQFLFPKKRWTIFNLWRWLKLSTKWVVECKSPIRRWLKTKTVAKISLKVYYLHRLVLLAL